MGGTSLEVALERWNALPVRPIQTRFVGDPHPFGAGPVEQRFTGNLERTLIHGYWHEPGIHGPQVSQGTGRSQIATDQNPVASLHTGRKKPSCEADDEVGDVASGKLMPGRGVDQTGIRSQLLEQETREVVLIGPVHLGPSQAWIARS